jgi:hypothetical protein
MDMQPTRANSDVHFCVYYQAHVQRSECWFLVAVLKSWEHVAFDRTVNVELSIFEFFVPVAMEERFLQLMQLMIRKNVLHSLCKLDNRLKDTSARV